MVEDILKSPGNRVQCAKVYCTKRKIAAERMIRESNRSNEADPKMSEAIRDKEFKQHTVLARAALKIYKNFPDPKPNDTAEGTTTASDGYLGIATMLESHLDAMAIYWMTHDMLFENPDMWKGMMTGFKKYMRKLCELTEIRYCDLRSCAKDSVAGGWLVTKLPRLLKDYQNVQKCTSEAKAIGDDAAAKKRN
eukprot:GHVO01052384.1.p1 GENE.GHVO01052384.1~~GHVO01052384.1.p1  ORF type:complete len:193 (+),score=23.28 GHVO01052384.1:2-580(+)